MPSKEGSSVTAEGGEGLTGNVASKEDDAAAAKPEPDASGEGTEAKVALLPFLEYIKILQPQS
jgi:hypothetical protein